MTVKLQLQNKIINGAFDYWQRGTSFAAIADGTYNADRWLYGKTGTMVHTVSRSSDVAVDASGVFSLLATPTTIQASILAGSNCFIGQRIEGNILRSFKSKKMVLTFKVKAFKAGVYCVSLRNSALDRSLIKEYTVNSSNTWETKIIRFTHDASGTWLCDAGLGMRLDFTLASGTTYQTTPDVWQTGNFLSTASQTNGVDSLSNTFQISDVCLVEDNDGATRVPDFQYAGRDVFEELQLCQRYYTRYNSTGVNSGLLYIHSLPPGTGSWQGFFHYEQAMRTSPAILHTGVASNYQIRTMSGTAVTASGTPTISGTNTVGRIAITASGLNMSAESLLSANTGDAFIAFDAEL